MQQKIFYGFYDIKNSSIILEDKYIKLLDFSYLILEIIKTRVLKRQIKKDLYEEEDKDKKQKQIIEYEEVIKRTKDDESIITFAFQHQKEKFCKLLNEKGIKYINYNRTFNINFHTIVKIINFVVGITNYSYDLISQDVVTLDKKKDLTTYKTTTVVMITLNNKKYKKTYYRNFSINKDQYGNMLKIAYTEALKSLLKEFVVYEEDNKWNIILSPFKN